MKNKKLESLKDNNLFGKFEANRLSDASASYVKGGSTSTTLCKTTGEIFDTDEQGSQESLADPRCPGTIEQA
jgi:hypothetical protein